MNRNDPRMIALDALMACLVEGKPLDETLERDRRMAALEKRDRALAYAITAEVCRRRGQIDALIKGCLQKPLPAKAALCTAICWSICCDVGAPCPLELVMTWK